MLTKEQKIYIKSNYSEKGAKVLASELGVETLQVYSFANYNKFQKKYTKKVTSKVVSPFFSVEDYENWVA